MRPGLGGKALAVRDSDLQFDQIQSGGQFGNRMLDLRAGIHLQEEELTGLVCEKLDGARAGVADGRGGNSSRLEQAVPHTRDGVNQWGRRLLDDLLVTALDRALPLADGPDGAVPVGHHLDLDVAAARR